MMIDVKKQVVLIVEDEPALLKVYAERFGDEGFSVLKASNGQEGLSIAVNQKLDLILLDILMPVMDGLTMMERLREHASWDESVPIIFLTNLSKHEQRIAESVTKNPPAYYLIKSDWSLSDIVKKAKLAVLSKKEKKIIRSKVVDFMKKKA